MLDVVHLHHLLVFYFSCFFFVVVFRLTLKFLITSRETSIMRNFSYFKIFKIIYYVRN